MFRNFVWCVIISIQTVSLLCILLWLSLYIGLGFEIIVLIMRSKKLFIYFVVYSDSMNNLILLKITLSKVCHFLALNRPLITFSTCTSICILNFPWIGWIAGISAPVIDLAWLVICSTIMRTSLTILTLLVWIRVVSFKIIWVRLIWRAFLIFCVWPLLPGPNQLFSVITIY